MTDPTQIWAAHLLRRAAFGGNQAQVEAAAAAGLEATVDALLAEAEPAPPLIAPADEPKYVRMGDTDPTLNIGDAALLWLQRLVTTRTPLAEKMALFWHGHFATSNQKVDRPLLMAHQYNLFRRAGLGRFADLLLGIAQDPAMLIWLDGDENHRDAPNENFAREVMELFTMGRGHYSEVDVKAAARAFTGWGLNDKDQFVYNEDDHDHGLKNFLGNIGDLSGPDIVNILARRPETARYLVSKLWRFFAYPNPEETVINDLVQVYMDTDGDLRAVMRALLLHPSFYSDKALGAVVKSPTVFVVAALRQVNPQWASGDTLNAMEFMGQGLFEPPNVAGWPGGLVWIDAATLLARFNFAAQLAGQVGGDGAAPPAQAQLLAAYTAPDGMLDYWCATLGGVRLSDASRQAALDYIGPASLDPDQRPAQHQRALHAVMAALEWQFE